jgi:hypothetical protein
VPLAERFASSQHGFGGPNNGKVFNAIGSVLAASHRNLKAISLVKLLVDISWCWLTSLL